jgi:hypothetical protein
MSLPTHRFWTAGAKFFSQCKRGAARVICRTKRSTRDIRHARSRRHLRCELRGRKPRLTGIFDISAKFRARRRNRKSFERIVLQARALRIARQHGRRHLHTKLSGVTVIFFLL